MLGALGVGSGAQAYSLPAPNPAYVVELGDFRVYSTPFLNLFFFGDQKGSKKAGNFIVDSSPGKIKDFLVVGSFPSAALDNTDVLGGAGKGDDAYQTPSAGGTLSWDTAVSPFCGVVNAGSCENSPDPGAAGEFTGDELGTWDVQISALNTFLAGGELVFFFNQNQTNSDQDIFIWALIAVVDNAVVDKLPTKYFELNSYLSGVFKFTSDEKLSPAFVDSKSPGEFVFAPGQQCVDPAPPFPVVSCDTPGNIVINHNLGAEDASYAIFSPELNTLVKSPGGYDVMQIRFALGESNNGFEQVFIMADVDVPGPATPLLLGSGLVALALLGWRRARRMR